jgi:hypothetical protein
LLEAINRLAAAKVPGYIDKVAAGLRAQA